MPSSYNIERRAPVNGCLARTIDLGNFQAATTRTARDINRRIVLNLIRKHQPVSRAELSRRSRLQRSTVSAITEQLISERWVTEGALGNLPRGRKPTYLHLNGDRAGIVGIDVRPSETRIVLSDLSMQFMAQESLPTGDDPDGFIAALCQRLRRLIAAHPQISFEGIGVALPGRVEVNSGRLVFAPNLGWKPLDFKTPLEQATGLSVEVENAANACAVAEMWSGRHAENVRNLLAVTVSEGIGVGIILNGQLVRGSTGLAGEFGHVTIREDGPLCGCGNRGCFEAVGSNTAAMRYFETLEHQRNGKKPARAGGFESLVTLAEQGDAGAREALGNMAHWLGVGTAMLITGLSPDVVVLIGEVTRVWDQVGPLIHDSINQRLRTGATVRIVPADAKAQSRLRGTIALVLQQHFGAPHIV